ncbi:response regulator [Thalassobacillus sp. CUG 92003]|uniref:response regulator n=1 Tax=Thalassobacillus sp. CUG 92003 TaxID=2736641 RepID=UPI0015E65C4A|nr:response regulator [Thalassobacillus sp. CUG 92003]
MINVLIVEDDPMVAQLNQRYVEKMHEFNISGIAENTDEALECIAHTAIDLILLDVYMPGLNGIEFLGRIREQNQDIDVILITAASDVEKIQQSLRLGAVDYLIKPFEFERFQQALLYYKDNYHTLAQKQQVNQHELDQLFKKENGNEAAGTGEHALPKGLTRNTLHIINTVILSNRTAFSTEDVAAAVNISRVSVRKYLKFLSEIGYLEETLIYGVGRPIYQYSLKEANRNRIDPYL